MDRRVCVVVALFACGGDAPDRAPVAPPLDAASAAPAVRPRVAVDAAPREVDAAPIRPTDVLSGPQAEQAISEQISPGIDAGAPGPEGVTYLVTPRGAGPFQLGMTRADVAQRIPERSIVKLRAPAGAPTREIATLVVDGAPLLRLRLYAARVVEIEVVRRDRRAATDGDVAVGSTFTEAIDEHGEPIRVRDTDGALRGWMMSELPGVVFVPEDPTELKLEQPPPAARIGRLVVLGAESLAPPD